VAVAAVGFIYSGLFSGALNIVSKPDWNGCRFPSKLAGGKAGLKWPQAQDLPFSNQLE
jgi:hypothetical protein